MGEYLEKLKILRIKQGISQKEIAEYLGITVASYSLYERGSREPSISILKKIANYYGVTLDFLMGFNKKNDEPLTIAAHFDGEEYTEEELDEIRQFAEFVKTKRKEPIKPIPFVEPLNAAHERTDVKVTDEMKKHDDNFFDEDDDKKEED